MNLYDILGLAPSATAEQIKKAWRFLAQRNHPDRGGDKEKYQAIQNAYDVLSDPERRTFYDATGNPDRPETPEEAMERHRRAGALQLIRGCLINAIQTLNIDKDDVLAKVKETASSALKEMQAQLATQLAQKEKAEKAARRIVSDEDTLASVLAGLAAEVDGAIAQTQGEIAQLELATEILSKAKYAYDIPTEEELEQQQREQLSKLLNQAAAQHFGSIFGRRV